MSVELTPLPARINLQIRDGVQNELVQFDVGVASSKLNEETGLTDHNVSVHDLIAGLARALATQVETLLDAADEPANRQWLADLRDWIFTGRAADA